jgi:hypothetical protein
MTLASLVPPKTLPVRDFFRTTMNYRETLYLQSTCGIVPLGVDLEKHNYECTLYWLNDRVQCMVMTSMIDGKSVHEARNMGMMKKVGMSFDPTVTTTEVWAFARLAIMVSVGLPFEVQAVETASDGSKFYPISHWVDELGNASCPNCKVGIARHQNRQPFPVGVPIRCKGCGYLILNQKQELRVKPPMGR